MSSRKYSRTVLLLGTVFAFLFGCFLYNPEPPKVQPNTQTAAPAPASSSSARPAYPPSPDAMTATPEQIAFVHSQLFPAWDHIRAYYPMPQLRREFGRLMQRTQGGDLRIRVEPKRFLSGAPPAMATRINGQLTIVLCVPALIDIWNEIGERETIADIIVGIMLHEQYHLDHHSSIPPEQVTRQQLIDHEAEAWWYTVEQCYLPMLQGGRLTHLPQDPDQSITNAVLAYQVANGRRNHPVWRQFAESVTSAPQ